MHRDTEPTISTQEREQLSAKLISEIVIYGIFVPSELQTQGLILLALAQKNSIDLNQALADQLDGASDDTFYAVVSVLEQLQNKDWFSMMPVLREAIAAFQEVVFEFVIYKLRAIVERHTTPPENEGGMATLREQFHDNLVREVAAYTRYLAHLSLTPLLGIDAKAKLSDLTEQIAAEFLPTPVVHQLMADVVDFLAKNPA